MTDAEKRQLYADIDANPIKAFKVQLKRGDATYLTMLPDYMLGGICRYLILGIKPGSFLTSIVAGEWDLARKRADATNAMFIDTYRAFLDEECPKGCHGSPEAVRAWCEKGGLVG